MPAPYPGDRNSLPILEMRNLSQNPACPFFQWLLRLEKSGAILGELLGLAGSPHSACPAFSKHQEKVEPFLKVEIPGAGLPSVLWIGQGLGGNRCW